MVSYAKFDVWQDTNGNKQNTVVQVVKSVLGEDLGTTASDQTNNFPSWVFSSTATVWTDTNNLQLTITPKFNNSLIKLDLFVFMHNINNGNNAGIRVLRGDKILWRPMRNATNGFSTGHLGSSSMHNHHFWTFYDTPNTTNAVTYRLQYCNYNSNVCHYFGYASANHWATTNSLTATEIAQ